ncbi:MAG: methylmalonyl-CoA mutase cobalamin-binding subunit [Gammaproteobacteria bacterium]|jgi:methylmalonyl-CoA mutase cobalamin-binding subunit
MQSHKIVDIPGDFPSFAQTYARAKQLSSEITIGKSCFLDKVGCQSELDYKQQCMTAGTIMYHAHIGLNDWPETEAALVYLDKKLRDDGHQLDRVGIALDRRMGLPPELRQLAAAETGPMITEAQQWNDLTQCAAIQPHMGDFMIGMPASVTNTLLALNAGVTTIGNLSQYFAFETPLWDDAVATAEQTTMAIALLGQFRDQGTLLHSYLEDGYGALFKDCRTVAGWAYLERYIVEELLGAKLSHCIGGLTTNPVRRAGWVFALDKIHGGECVGSMIYGDTLSFTQDFERNRAVVSEYLTWDILAQLHCPTGHAVLPLPVTEAVRIPSAEEVYDAQRLGRQIELSARRLYPHVDFTEAERFASEVCEGGEQIFNRALAGLAAEGIDTQNPLVLLYLLKKMGPEWFEDQFGLEPQTAWLTDITLLGQSVVSELTESFSAPYAKQQFAGVKLLLASTDVHAHAIASIEKLLNLAGAEVINLGVEQGVKQIVSAMQKHEPSRVLLSTHNGVALEYARQLKTAMQQANLMQTVYFGGVLNQKVDDQALPVEVTNDLEEMGFIPIGSAEMLLTEMRLYR